MTGYSQVAYKGKQKYLSAIDTSVTGVYRRKQQTVPSHFNDSSRTKMTAYWK